MRAVGSKQWYLIKDQLKLWLVAIAVSISGYYCVQNLVADEVAFIADNEGDWLLDGVIPEACLPISFAPYLMQIRRIRTHV